MSTLEGQLDAALGRAYVAAYRLLRSRDEAKDACQEAAAKALEHRARYDASRAFYPWFYRILRNHCLDRLAQRKRQGSTDDTTLAQKADGRASAEELLIADERSRALFGAVEHLPDDLREVIEFRHFQDLSYEEMAEVLEIPLGTVMSRLYRARNQLREALSGKKARSGR